MLRFLPIMAFPILLVSFLVLIICIFKLKKYVFLFRSLLGLFYLSSIFYHHTFFSAVELQGILKLSSYLLLILLFHDSSIFWWWPPLFSHILVNLFSLCTAHSFSSVEIDLHFSTLFWYFWFPAEVVLHIILHLLGTKEWTREKREVKRPAPFKYIALICGSKHLPDLWWMTW